MHQNSTSNMRLSASTRLGVKPPNPNKKQSKKAVRRALALISLSGKNGKFEDEGFEDEYYSDDEEQKEDMEDAGSFFGYYSDEEEKAGNGDEEDNDGEGVENKNDISSTYDSEEEFDENCTFFGYDSESDGEETIIIPSLAPTIPSANSTIEVNLKEDNKFANIPPLPKYRNPTLEEKKLAIQEAMEMGEEIRNERKLGNRGIRFGDVSRYTDRFEAVWDELRFENEW